MEQEPKPEDVQFLIGPYQVLKRIGQGGIGEVFLVYDPIYHRKIALKRLRSDRQADEQKRQLFLNEARFTSQLTHPYIINIFTIAEEKDQVYYTMPFIEGSTLQDILIKACQNEREGVALGDEISIPACTHYFLKICQAVAYAHSKEVIHSDLKPFNIIIGSYGELRILDWGIGMAVEGKNENSHLSPQKTGTVMYVAPEITRRMPPSEQTEIYTLGLILYEMLTLRFPFHRDDLKEYNENVQREVLLDPAQVAPYRNIPPLLSRMALKCLAYAPEDRYKTVEEIIGELEDSQSLAENLWAVPTAFLAEKNYSAALREYRNISRSRPKTTEGREAIFQAGITLLEEAKSLGESAQSLGKSTEALEEFSKLHGTPGEPLEYFGQARVYQWLKDTKKEIQSYEKAFNCHPHHSLMPFLFKGLLDRLQEISAEDRITFYHFALLALCYQPKDAFGHEIANLARTLKLQLKPLYFIDWPELSNRAESQHNLALAVHLAFLLDQPQIIDHIILSAKNLNSASLPVIEQALMALIELGSFELARQKIDVIFQQFLDVQAIAHLEWMRAAIDVHEKKTIQITFLAELPLKLGIQHLRPLFYILEEALRRPATGVVIETIKILFNDHELTAEQQQILLRYLIWAFLLEKNWESAEKFIKLYPKEVAQSESFQFLNDCWLHAIRKTPITLPKIPRKAFLWEKRQIYRYYILFYHCIGDSEKERYYRKKEEKTYLSPM